MLKVYGFGLDGVLVMIGLDKGVSGRLNKLNFYILNIDEFYVLYKQLMEFLF